MKPLKIFISSVQKEFAAERKALAQYLREDALLGSFFEVFLFEETAAASHNAAAVYLTEVEASHIYVGLLGSDYGYEDEAGISPTEREYDAAGKHNLQRWVYVKGNDDAARHPKEQAFVKKISEEVSRKRFSSLEDLKKEVYKSCVLYLKQSGKITSSNFDESLNTSATIDDISEVNLQRFVRDARAKRNFPLKETDGVVDILKHLNLFREGHFTNSALLAFGKKPQKYFPSATVKCTHFHGLEIEKPIPDYKEFDGTVFDLAVKATDFILSKISVSTGIRDKGNSVNTTYEIPRSVIAEAVINAIAHRDYTSKASVQVSVFKDRVEILNPGRLPDELELSDLQKPHASYPHNPLLANCMFLTGDIERYGTGTLEIYKLTAEAKLNRPQFDIDEGFKVVLWRPSASTDQATDQVSDQVTDQVSDQVPDLVERLIKVLDKPMKRAEIMVALDLKHNPSFREYYLTPAMAGGYIEMTNPDSPNSPKQQYKLTDKGKKTRNRIIHESK